MEGPSQADRRHGQPFGISGASRLPTRTQGRPLRRGGFPLPDWFAEIVSIVHLQATSERIKSATEGLAKALDELARRAKDA